MASKPLFVPMHHVGINGDHMIPNNPVAIAAFEAKGWVLGHLPAPAPQPTPEPTPVPGASPPPVSSPPAKARATKTPGA